MIAGLKRPFAILLCVVLSSITSFSQKKGHVLCVPPTITISPDVSICPGSSTTLDATMTSGTAPLTYDWSPGTGLSVPQVVTASTTTSTVASPSATITYTVIGYDVQGAGCPSTAAFVTVFINPTPTITITGPNTVCSGSSLTLTASGGVSYVWAPGGETTTSIAVTPTITSTYTVTGTNSSGCTATATQSVSFAPQPFANAGLDVSICLGDVTTLNGSNGSSNGTYSWAPITDLSCTTCPNPVTTAAGTYTLTVTNSCGSAVDDMTISITPIPSANAGPDVTICIGSNTTLTGTGSGTLAWSLPATLSCTACAITVANPTVTTTYTFSVTGSCGTGADSVKVTVNNPVAAITGNATICSGQSTTLTASGGISYVWSTTQIINPIVDSPVSTTNYSVVATDGNGCTSTANYTVNVGSATATITGVNSLCSGQSSTLTASGGNSYLWSTTETTTSIVVSPIVPTTYTVTSTGTFGCTQTGTYSVNVTAQPTASITASTATVCAGSATTLNASGGATFAWSTGAVSSSIVVSPLVLSCYSVVVSNGACSDVANICVGVNALPTTSLTATASTVCLGSCSSLSVSGSGTSYTWQPGGMTGTIISACPGSPTIYTVTATDGNGCTAQATTAVNVVPKVVALVSGPTSLCAGSPGVLTAQGGGTYLWSTSEIDSVITVTATANTTYTVTVSNGFCSDDTTISVNIAPVPVVDASASPYTINIGAQTTLTGTSSIGTFIWSPTTALSCDTCANPVANPTTTTIYTLTSIDANGCSSMDTVIVNVTLECGDPFVPSAFSPNDDGHNDYLYVRNPCIDEMVFTVYNRWGQKVFVTTDPTKGWDGRFNDKPMDPAVFFYTLKVKDITGVDKEQSGNVSLVR